MKIDPKQIPDEVWKALQLGTGMSETAARGLAAVMLSAWPGATSIEWDGQLIVHLKMPLPTEGE